MLRKVPLILIGLLFVLGYLEIGAQIFGSWQALLADPARVSFAGGMVLLALVTGLSEFNFSLGTASDLENNWIFLPLLGLGILLGCVGPYCDRHGIAVFRSTAVRWVGVAIFAVGVGLRIAAMRTLGSRFSIWVALQDGHVLVTDGLYRHVRHPSYTGALLALIGSAMVFRSEWALAIALAMVMPLIPRMAAEEKMLIERFGAEYTDFQDRTWRILPWVY